MLSVSPCCHNNPKLVCKCLYVTLYWSVTCSQYFMVMVVCWLFAVSQGHTCYISAPAALVDEKLSCEWLVGGAVVTSGDAP